MSNINIAGENGLIENGAETNTEMPAETSISLSGSTLDWYKLTETSRHVLTQVVSGSIQQQLEELQKPNPDMDKIYKLEQVSLKVSKLSRDPQNFRSKQRMIKIIEDYSNYVF